MQLRIIFRRVFMNDNKKTIIEMRINKTGANLKKNNMEFYYAPTAADVRGIVESLMPEGCTVTHGGSESMKECGIPELLIAQRAGAVILTAGLNDQVDTVAIGKRIDRLALKSKNPLVIALVF